MYVFSITGGLKCFRCRWCYEWTYSPPTDKENPEEEYRENTRYEQWMLKTDRNYKTKSQRKNKSEDKASSLWTRGNDAQKIATRARFEQKARRLKGRGRGDPGLSPPVSPHLPIFLLAHRPQLQKIPAVASSMTEYKYREQKNKNIVKWRKVILMLVHMLRLF